MLSARVTLAMGALDHAEAAAAHVQLNDPYNTDALDVIAEALFAKGYFRAAERYTRRALNIDPDDRVAASLLARVAAAECNPPSGVRLVRAPDRDAFDYYVSQRRTPSHCAEAVACSASHPFDPVLSFEFGMCLLSLGRPAEAKQALADAEARLPSQRRFADATPRLDITGEASSTYGRLRTADAEKWNSMGYDLFQRGRTEEAATCFRSAIEADRTLAAAHNNLARVYLIQKRRDDAVACYRDAIYTAPRDTEGYVGLASLLAGEKQWAEAVRTLDTAHSLAPADRDLALRLAWLLATVPDDALRDGARALKLADAALSADAPRRASDLNILAAACAETGDFDRAVSVTREAVSLAEAEHNKPLTEALDHCLKLYLARQPARLP